MDRILNYIKLLGWVIVILIFVWVTNKGLRLACDVVPVYHTIQDRQIDPSALFYTESEAPIQSERKLLKN